MATRSIIKFTDGSDVIGVYKHWDGYPDVTVPMIQEFVEWNGMRNGDLEYTVANFCFWYKHEGEERDYHTGIGVLANADGDRGQEYEYIVDLNDQSITATLGTNKVWNFTEYVPEGVELEAQ
jgi:hypothetical protein